MYFNYYTRFAIPNSRRQVSRALQTDMVSAGISTSINPSESTKLVATPEAPATVQKARRRSDLNLNAVPAPKRQRPQIGSDPDALRSRGFEYFDIKIIETKVPQSGKYSGNFAFCYNESGLEDLYIKEERKRQLEVHMGGECVTG